ncbi:deferrochelatase/peroxidase EfeB [Scopulibacillus darangshiensis]|uniref:Deferrochelatase n=1 Tax=Scopulibacillus darangshiensis TaxID=442528 RepID=A0A4R2NK25_9BACL|nr:iron uptake transporter deferrochelatase/peroxidase subunit [Scopulibacillus darangshiensis]TCP21929.1 deferrochelatase/peroxidase EfeB [Scopulibacillus darangshiensis]
MSKHHEKRGHHEDMEELEKSSGISRREMLKMSAAAGTGLAIGMSGMGALVSLTDVYDHSKAAGDHKVPADIVPFYGRNQAGIATAQQQYICFAAFDVTASKRSDLKALLKTWTKYSADMTKGETVGEKHPNVYMPPDDTGEAFGLSPSNLTITFGFGPTLFKKDGVDRFGIAVKQPDELVPIPHMPRDELQKEISGGDICIQACSDDPIVAMHAVRNLMRVATGSVIMRYMQEGFLSSPNGETPRNLFGFKDGTANKDTQAGVGLNKYVWASDSGGPSWMKGGSYMAVRKIRMFTEVWDRTSLKEQEATFGREKKSGAPLGKAHEFDSISLNKLPAHSHTRLAHSTGIKILRRAYSYSSGLDPRTGYFDTGLFFISFQQSIKMQFIPMLKKLQQSDKLNEYTSHISSAVFACPPGIKKGGYIGQQLFHSL